MLKDAAAAAAIPPEEAAKLAALGYISSAGAAAPGEALPDPKEKRQTFRDLRSAFSLFRAGDNEHALTAFQTILRENPRMTDVWDVTAKTYWRLGRQDEAIDAAKQGLKTNPGSPILALTVANFALDAGRLDDAEQHAQLVLRLDPPRAHEVLARVFLARGDLASAEKEARLAAGGGDRAAANVTLARVLKQANRFEESLAAANEAERIVTAEHKPPFAGLSFLRGDLLARRRRGSRRLHGYGRRDRDREGEVMDEVPTPLIVLLWAIVVFLILLFAVVLIWLFSPLILLAARIRWEMKQGTTIAELEQHYLFGEERQ
jgi:Tfp pilus assembly protein PilF